MRVARWISPGLVYHLIWRFRDRSWLMAGPTDRAQYSTRLGAALATTDWRCLAYAFMSSHVHLALVAGREPLADWSRRAHVPFAQWLNRRYDRLGAVFADRARAIAVMPEKVPFVLAYLHNNPVRAGVVRRAVDSRWTSHRAYLGRAAAPGWLHVAEGLQLSGCANAAEFARLVGSEPGDGGGADEARMRREARAQGAIEVATPTFGDMNVVPLVATALTHFRPDPRWVVQVVVDAAGADEAIVRSRRRMPAAVAVRSVIARCGLATGLTGTDLGRALGVSSHSVYRLARRPIGDAERALLGIARERMRTELESRAPERWLRPAMP